MDLTENPGDLPEAPPVPFDDPTTKPVDKLLRLVVILTFVNLGLSVLVMVAAMVTAAVTRKSLIFLVEPPRWLEASTVVVLVAAVYLDHADRLLHRGSRKAYVRVLWSCAISILVMIGITLDSYPVWVRVEQVVQGLVLVALLFTVTHRKVRDRFAKSRYQ